MKKVDKTFNSAHDKVYKQVEQLSRLGNFSKKDAIVLLFNILKLEQAAVNLGHSL